MRRWDEALRRYVDESATGDAELRRIADRLDAELGKAGSLRQSLLDLPQADAGATERVAVRLDRARARRPGWAARLRIDAADPRLAWRAPALAAAAAVLLIGGLAVRSVSGPPAAGPAPGMVASGDEQPHGRGADAPSGHEVGGEVVASGADTPSRHEVHGEVPVSGPDTPSVHEVGSEVPVSGPDTPFGHEVGSEALASGPDTPSGHEGDDETADRQGPDTPSGHEAGSEALASGPDSPSALDPVPSADGDAVVLASATSWSEVRPSTEVSLRYRGEGVLRSTAPSAPRVTWSSGTLEVDVVPDRGVDLQIETPDALVAVVGTVFDISADPTGTTVSVRRGKVRVSCVVGDTTLLTAGHTTTCAPATPAGLLAHARVVSDRAAALALVDRGLATARPGPVHDELLYLRVELLVALDRPHEARAAAGLYLRDPDRPRAPDVRALLERLP